MASIARLSNLGRVVQHIIKNGRNVPTRYTRAFLIAHQERGNSNF